MFPYKATLQPMGAPANLPQNSISVINKNQWPSQSAYQNIDLDTVDWAALAQQWIHMKETCTPPDDAMPKAPPPPRISNSSTVKDYDEQGEAPMEVEHDDEPVMVHHESIINTPLPPPAPQIFASNWINSGRSQTHPKQWQKKTNRWNAWPNPNIANQSNTHRIPPPPPLMGEGYSSGQVYNLKQSDGIWPINSSHANATFVHCNNSNEIQTHGSDANFKSGTQLENIDLMSSTPLDAAQRKTLPAWIREGLEKMEREKQKEADRIREMRERDEKRRQDKLTEQNLIHSLKSEPPMTSQKSKFESDSESDEENDGNSDGDKNRNMAKSTAEGSSPLHIDKPHRSKADILMEIMLSVRKNLTEILLEVTNEEIFDIAQDTLSKMRSKGRKAQTVQKNALTAITGGLGLVTYDDSDGSKSSSDSEDEDETDNVQNSDFDSDSELKKTIQRRKIAFEAKSIEIESFLAETEEKEKQWLEQDKDNENVKSNDTNNLDDNPSPSSSSFGNNQNKKDSGEIQHDKNKLSSVSARKLERRGSRFSDAKGLFYNVANNVVAPNAGSNQFIRLNSVEQKPAAIEVHNVARGKKDPDSGSDSSHQSSKWSKTSQSKQDKTVRPASNSGGNGHKKRKRNGKNDRRSKSSSSDRSYSSRYSRNSTHDRTHKGSRRDRSRSRHREHSHTRRRDRSRSKHRSRYSRSSSDDRTSKSSYSNKRDQYSRDKGYKSSKRSRSRSHSYDSRSSHRHR